MSPDQEKPAADSLERTIAGAIRQTIETHGALTLQNYSSAVKRIMGQLKNARASGLGRAMAAGRWARTAPQQRSAHAAAMANKRWKNATKKQKRDAMSAAASSRWASMTVEERSEEMKRRRLLGLSRKGGSAP